MLVFSTILFTFLSISFSEGAVVDVAEKCSINDEDCLKSLHQYIFNDVKKTGVSEISLAPIEPLSVKDYSLTILNGLKAKLVDGVLKGIGSCVFTKYSLDVENRIASHDLVCEELIIKGHIKLSGTNEKIQSLLGTSSVNADGKGKLKLEKVQLKFKTILDLFKKEDDKIYMKLEEESAQYSYSIAKATFFAENILIGNTDVSQLGAAYMNQHWRSIMKSYGPVFLRTAVNIYTTAANKFLANVPTDEYIVEDLSHSVEN